ILKTKDPNTVTVDDLAEELTPAARAAVPEDIKAEILEQIQVFLSKNLPDSE
ncbi:hypothetical protein EV182_007699, partial [Spiromyces aspiralis]